MSRLTKIVNGLTKILSSDKTLKEVMKKDLTKILEDYPTSRLTEIKDEVTEIKIDTTEMIPKEDVIVMLTKDGYIKRTSYRSYQATTDAPTLKENDFVIGLYEMNTLDTLLVFTSLGNYLHIPVHTIIDSKWKDMGKHISNLIPISEDEEIIACIPAYDFSGDDNIILASKDGMIKRSELKAFRLSRYSKPTSCMKLKENDKLISAYISKKDNVFISTRNGYSLAFKTEEIPVIGVKAAGVKAITLKEDEVVSVNSFSYDTDEFITVVTEKSTCKRVRLSEFDLSTRTRKGLLLIREVKTNPYKILKVFVTDNKNHLGLKTSTITDFKTTEIPILDRYSTGKEVMKDKVQNAFIFTDLIKTTKDEVDDIKIIEVASIPKKEQIDLNDIDNRLLTIDDFLN